MYVPDQYGILRFHVPVRSAPATAVPLLDELTGKALPFFDRYGHPEGLRELCRERIDREPADRVNPHDLRCLAATEVILGRYDEASRTYARLATTATRSSPPWAKDLAEEGRVRSLLLRHEPAVVHEALTEMIDRQLAHLGLPLDRE